jgi:hypothetical protein
VKHFKTEAILMLAMVAVVLAVGLIAAIVVPWLQG